LPVRRYFYKNVQTVLELMLTRKSSVRLESVDAG